MPRRPLLLHSLQALQLPRHARLMPKTQTLPDSLTERPDAQSVRPTTRPARWGRQLFVSKGFESSTSSAAMLCCLSMRTFVVGICH